MNAKYLLSRSDDGAVVDMKIQSGCAAEREQWAVFHVSRLVSESVLASSRYAALPECTVILASSCAEQNPISRKQSDFMLPQSVADWERIAGDDPMFSELKKKVELYSAEDKLAMQQRAIDDAR